MVAVDMCIAMITTLLVFVLLINEHAVRYLVVPFMFCFMIFHIEECDVASCQT